MNNHTLRNTICTLILTLSACAAVAQTTGLQKFVGVWSPTGKEGFIGNIKITVQNSNISIKIKYNKSIKEGSNIKVSGNSVSWTIPDDEGTQYGEWYLQNGNIYKVNGGSNGEATNIYNRSGRAKVENNYIFMSAEFIDSGEMKLYYSFRTDYYNSNWQLLFDQSSNTVFYRDYSNW